MGNFIHGQQDSTGLPGDNFSLEGALSLFNTAKSPEEFEQLLNSESSHVNNLDLNQDGEIDYIKVMGRMDKDVHIFILQVPISAAENQDIAVIELEKVGDNEAHIQIVGDEEIFGEEMIVEPGDGSQEEEMEEHKGGGPSPSGLSAFVVVNVWGWPCVRYIYTPGYVEFNSAWRWKIYPSWWAHRRPYAYSVWRPYRYNHRVATVRVVHTHRLVAAHRMYTPGRAHSTTVRTHYAGAHKNYTVTKKKTTVTGPHGRSHTKTTKTVKGPHGHTKSQSTKVRRGK